MTDTLDNALENAQTRPRLIVSACGTGTCPTIYRTDRGTVLVQGYPVTAAQAGVDLPPGELLVEIPADLLLAAGGQVTAG
jgi:hypothetical protein